MSDEATARTVGELVDLLSGMPRDMRVLVRGYEGGYDALTLTVTGVVDNGPHVPEYYGRYGLPVPWEGDRPVAFTAVLFDDMRDENS